jgi:hypothetical protein
MKPMELVELAWNDENDLCFQFQKAEPHNFIAEDVQNLNLKFELVKVDKHDIYKEPPFLVSVKNLHFFDNLFAFSISLDELKDIENLQINVVKLTIFLQSGEKLDVFVDKNYTLSELGYQESDYFEYMEEETVYKRRRKVSIKKTSIKRPRKKKTTIIDINPKISQNNYNIRKRDDRKNENIQIPISDSEYEKWLNLKGDKSWETTMFMVREGFEKFKEMESEVKTLNKTIQKIALKSASGSQQPIYLQSNPNIVSPNQLNPPPGTAPPKRKDDDINIKYSLESPTSQKVFRDKKDPNSMKHQIEIMREMKQKFDEVNDVKDLLEKVPEEEIKKPRAKTDHLAFLEFKLGEEDKKRKNLVEKLKSLGYEKDTEILTLEDMKIEIEDLVEKKND